MKPTVKVIVTSYNEADSYRFVSDLSEIEVGHQERKIPDPFSPTKEEATLWMQVGRVEWENVIIQMQNLGARRRYDFIWPVLLPEVYGVIVLADMQDRENWQATRVLLRLFKMMAYRNCLVAIKRVPTLSAQEFRAMSAQLETEYTLTTYAPDDKESMVNVLHAWLKIVPPPDEPVRRRGRNAGRSREAQDVLPSNPD
jgi:signal recognition particle receptor subunit beta